MIWKTPLYQKAELCVQYLSPSASDQIAFLGGAGTGLALIISDALQCTPAEQWQVRLVHGCITQFGNAVTWQGAVVVRQGESETDLTKEGEFALLNHVKTRPAHTAEEQPAGGNP